MSNVTNTTNTNANATNKDLFAGVASANGARLRKQNAETVSNDNELVVVLVPVVQDPIIANRMAANAEREIAKASVRIGNRKVAKAASKFADGCTVEDLANANSYKAKDLKEFICSEPTDEEKHDTGRYMNELDKKFAEVYLNPDGTAKKHTPRETVQSYSLIDKHNLIGKGFEVAVYNPVTDEFVSEKGYKEGNQYVFILMNDIYNWRVAEVEKIQDSLNHAKKLYELRHKTHELKDALAEVPAYNGREKSKDFTSEAGLRYLAKSEEIIAAAAEEMNKPDLVEKSKIYPGLTWMRREMYELLELTTTSVPGMHHRTVEEIYRFMLRAKDFKVLYHRVIKDNLALRAIADQYNKTGSGVTEAQRNDFKNEKWYTKRGEEVMDASKLSEEELEEATIMILAEEVKKKYECFSDDDRMDIHDQKYYGTSFGTVEEAKAFILGLIISAKDPSNKNSKGIKYARDVYDSNGKKTGDVEEKELTTASLYFTIDMLVKRHGFDPETFDAPEKLGFKNHPSYIGYLNWLEGLDEKEEINKLELEEINEELKNGNISQFKGDSLNIMSPHAKSAVKIYDNDGVEYESIFQMITAQKTDSVERRLKELARAKAVGGNNFYDFNSEFMAAFSADRYTQTPAEKFNFSKECEDYAASAVIQRAIGDHDFRELLKVAYLLDMKYTDKAASTLSNYNLESIYRMTGALIAAGKLPSMADLCAENEAK